ncbi:hypothetical protein [Streptomyces sp. CBMA156]|uniref:hypothetical protein n=1 Tax=Streptomyces sp. CBMA156 TaxID=1930280 RepID=UPI001661E3AA|nr:hypothetical protein [Streptomyces sp. CBMA156]MBD0670132.1 hypothetical protein [Streptomyces sp. CBMA156]
MRDEPRSVAEAGTTREGSSHLAVALSAGPKGIGLLDGNIAYTVSVTTPDDDRSSWVRVDMKLPAGTTFTSGSGDAYGTGCTARQGPAGPVADCLLDTQGIVVNRQNSVTSGSMPGLETSFPRACSSFPGPARAHPRSVVSVRPFVQRSERPNHPCLLGSSRFLCASVRVLRCGRVRRVAALGKG